jgi:hypothetical protein
MYTLPLWGQLSLQFTDRSAKSSHPSATPGVYCFSVTSLAALMVSILRKSITIMPVWFLCHTVNPHCGGSMVSFSQCFAYNMFAVHTNCIHAAVLLYHLQKISTLNSRLIVLHCTEISYFSSPRSLEKFVPPIQCHHMCEWRSWFLHTLCPPKKAGWTCQGHSN